MEKHLSDVVEGDSVRIGDEAIELGSAAVVHRIKKAYKIQCAKGKGAGRQEGKEDRSEIESVVLGCMALKGE